jgi:hypothetical protein
MVTILAALAIGLPVAALLGGRREAPSAASPAIDAALPLAGSAKMWWMVSRILASPSVGLLVAEPETGLA